MDLSLEKDIASIKEFMRHSAEFIAYFELTDTKMHEWKISIEQQIAEHHTKYRQQMEHITQQLQVFENLLTQAGLARFRLMADNILVQSNTHLQEIKTVARNTLEQMQFERQELTDYFNKSFQCLQEYCYDATKKIDRELSRHDPEHFRRTASESCDQVERTATDAIIKSKRMLRSVHWKTALLTIITSIITAFTIGLYVSDELPWEQHQEAMNEREAGKLLIQAWPQLSHEDRRKILHYDKSTLG